MKNIKLEIIKLENDIISTSAPLFNTLRKQTTRWYFYNVDLNNDGCDTSKEISCYDGYPITVGVDSSLYSTYQAIANSISQEGTYHYINGQWVECTDGKNHKLMRS